ncbi:hypothetical protein [Pseudomonas sp.]|uniref:hypothetical protein n=1 Tax=Pseudomonas sp. TaxID=306 RepID=UPI00258F32A1|nr:hypothetical protein [Pseudomonas sp.]
MTTRNRLSPSFDHHGGSIGIKLANNAVSRMAWNISNSATTIVLVSGEGALFPALAAGEWFPATIINSANALEIVKVTARSGDTLTGERGGASKAAVRRGDLRVGAMQSSQIGAAPTQADFNRLQANVAALYGLFAEIRRAGSG